MSRYKVELACYNVGPTASVEYRGTDFSCIICYMCGASLVRYDEVCPFFGMYDIFTDSEEYFSQAYRQKHNPEATLLDCSWMLPTQGVTCDASWSVSKASAGGGNQTTSSSDDCTAAD